MLRRFLRRLLGRREPFLDVATSRRGRPVDASYRLSRPLARGPVGVMCLIDRIEEIDRQFFARNPGVDRFLRPYLCNEFWPQQFDTELVEVVRLTPTIVTRSPFPWPPRKKP